MEGAAAIVVLWSVHSIDSVWVQDEAGFGRDHHRLVPILIDAAAPPLGFRQLQCVDLVRGGKNASNAEMQRALLAIAELLGRRPVKLRTTPLLDRRTAIVGGGAVVAGAIAIGAWRYGNFGQGSATNSIAVLPFQNLSGDASKQYLSDGIAAEVRATLSRNPLLMVMGQASSNKFRDPSDDSRGIARKLNVSSLLDGNIMVAGNVIRIAVELVQGSTGFSRWSEKFERQLSDILSLQDDIANAVDSALSSASRAAIENCGPATAALKTSPHSTPTFGARTCLIPNGTRLATGVRWRRSATPFSSTLDMPRREQRDRGRLR